MISISDILILIIRYWITLQHHCIWSFNSSATIMNTNASNSNNLIITPQIWDFLLTERQKQAKLNYLLRIKLGDTDFRLCQLFNASTFFRMQYIMELFVEMIVWLITKKDTRAFIIRLKNENDVTYWELKKSLE